MVGRILTASLYALGVVLYSLGAAGLVRRIGKKSPKILLYHDCAPKRPHIRRASSAPRARAGSRSILITCAATTLSWTLRRSYQAERQTTQSP